MSTKYEDKKKEKLNLKISRKSHKKTTNKIVNVKITEIKPKIIVAKETIKTSSKIDNNDEGKNKNQIELSNQENILENTPKNNSKKSLTKKIVLKAPQSITHVETNEKNISENTSDSEITNNPHNIFCNTEPQIDVQNNNTTIKDNNNDTPETNESNNQTSIGETTNANTVHHKRNLKLNTSSEKVQDVYKKPDVSINQNSSFFYTPSIFSRYNINITNIDDDNSSIEDDNAIQEIKNEEQVLDNQNEINTVQETKLEEQVMDNQNEINTVQENKSEEQVLDSHDEISTVQENKSEEQVMDNQNEINTVQETKLEEQVLDSHDEISTVQENKSEEQVLDNQDSINTENINLDDISLDDLVEFSQDDNINETSNEIIPDSDLTTDVSNVHANSNNEFIHSSTDTINKNDIKKPNSSYISKVKKNIFSNLSSVFKKFSYEQNELINLDELKKQSVFKDFSNTNDTVINDTIQSAPNEISIDMNSIDFEEKTSESVNTNDLLSTTDFIENSIDNTIEPNLQNLTSNNVEKHMEQNITNIDKSITINSENNLGSFAIDDIDDIFLENDDSKKSNTNENSDTDVSDDDNMFNLNSTEYDNEYQSIDYSDIAIDSEEDTTDYDNDFSIEDYFGVSDIKSSEKKETEKRNKKSKKNFSNKANTNNELDTDNSLPFVEETISDDILSGETVKNKQDNITKSNLKEEYSSLSKMLNNVTDKIASISDRLSEIENKTNNETTAPSISPTTVSSKEINGLNNIDLEDISIDDIILDDVNLSDISLDDNSSNNKTVVEDINSDNIDINSANLSDLDNFSNELDTLAFITDDTTNLKKSTTNNENISIDNQNNSPNENEENIEDILSKAFSKDNNNIDESMKNELLTELINVENEEASSDNNENNEKQEVLNENDEFFTIIDTLAKTITQLENSAEIKTPEIEHPNTDGKSINILINKDDIFSISILNETYEIVADFDGISVLSENINISTPKRNFYVTVGEKYIEIHNNGSNFSVNTNFEDIEFANAINNVAFAKKNNIIELNIKEAFKLSSINNKVELSMLNTSVADLKPSNVETSETINESSICDNRTLLISEETQKVYLPYTIEELMHKLNNSDEYQTLEDVIENEYTVPLSTFKMPIISRFKEAYRFMRTKEHSSVYAALDLALELMFNSNLNPAVIRASKDLKELNVYLDCLYENEIDKFDCFKIVYKVLPKIK